MTHYSEEVIMRGGNDCMDTTSTTEIPSDAFFSPCEGDVSPPRISTDCPNSISPTMAQNQYCPDEPPRLMTVRSFLGQLSTDVDNKPISYSPKTTSKQQYSRRIRVSKDDYLTNFRVPIGQSYVIRRKLGQGSWGAVHEAVERSSGFLRAIKKIPKKADLTRFRQEMTILKGFDHPRIIRLYETFEDYGHLYMVMEYCRGGELFDRLAEEGPLPEPVAAFLMKQVLSAVAYCHSLGVVHRDLKPENFLFLEKDIRSPLKLVDFGLAQRMMPNTMMRSAVGTIYYLAPELLSGEYDFRVDSWSAGIILYIMLFGTPPFVGESETMILRAIRDGNMDFINRDISNSARNLIMGLCCRDPERRLLPKDALKHAWFHAHWPAPLMHLESIIPLSQSQSEPYTNVQLLNEGAERHKETVGINRATSMMPGLANSSSAPFCCDFSELQSGHSKRCVMVGNKGTNGNRRVWNRNWQRRETSSGSNNGDIHLAGALTHLRKLGVQNKEEAAKLAEKIVEKWKHFASLNPLKRAFLSLAAQQLEHARELSYIRSIFDLLDMDGDGILSKEELVIALQKLRTSGSCQQNGAQEISPDVKDHACNFSLTSTDSFASELSELTAYVDLDGNGQIEYSEFAAACLDSSTYTQEATEKAVFRLLDRDGDGLIGQGELKRALGWLAPNNREWSDFPDPEIVTQIIVTADIDKDGYIGQEDFKAILSSDESADGTSRLYNADDLPPPHVYDEVMGKSCDQFDFSAVARSSFYGGARIDDTNDYPAFTQQTPVPPLATAGHFTQEALDEMRRYKLEQSRKHIAQSLRDQYALQT